MQEAYTPQIENEEEYGAYRNMQSKESKLERTVFFEGLTEEMFDAEKPLREKLEFREYGAGQVMNFIPFKNGLLVEYSNTRFAEQAESLMQLDGVPRIERLRTHTIEDAEEETRREEHDELLRLRSDTKRESELRKQAQFELQRMAAQVQQLQAANQDLSRQIHTVRPAQSEENYMTAWRSGVAQYIYFDMKTLNRSLQLDRQDPFMVHNPSSDRPCVIQSDRPLTLLPGCNAPCGYFEVMLIDGGKNNAVTIGLAPPAFARLFHQPGWSNNSMGYHGDDGVFYWNYSNEIRDYRSKKFGSTWKKGDVVGCGYNYETQESFFTLNGKLLGTGVKGMTGFFYPTIGTSSPGSAVKVNFGKEAFKFEGLIPYVQTLRS